ncbi:hypothetical protein F5Y17DRAFT_457456 [Xylariaceae sp. FL0594]|nr:hypothetical protein F5Y17DRAFT_457456 [Xylariaceae sp. FL0594]
MSNDSSSMVAPSRRAPSPYPHLADHDGTMSEEPPSPVLNPPAASLPQPSLPISARNISAGFSDGGPLSSNPTTACSTVTASTVVPHPGPLTSHPVNGLSSTQPIRHMRPPAAYSTRMPSAPRRQYDPNSLAAYLAKESSGLPHSQSQGIMRKTGPERSLRASQTYSNLPLPAKHHKSYSSSAMAQPRKNVENVPPSGSMASNGTTLMGASMPTTPIPAEKSSPQKKPKKLLGIPTSRTLNALSTITASLSRNTFGKISGSHSRKTSASSKCTTRTFSGPYSHSSPAASTSSQGPFTPSAESAESPDPTLIHTAKSSSYWTGRFAALQDRYLSETLEPENLLVLTHVYGERSLLPLAQPSIPSSATTSYISGAAASGSTHPINRPTELRRPPKLRQPQVEQTMAAERSRKEAVAQLVDEDKRAQRIFKHLESLCTADEARKSLRAWQQSYARREGKWCLLPEGGTMFDSTRKKEPTWLRRHILKGGNGSGTATAGNGDQEQFGHPLTRT